MKADGYGRKPGSLLVIVFLTVILTLLLAGGTAYFMGYLRPSEPGTGVKKAASSHTKKEKILYWRAPMNPTEIYDKPGKSAMGMDLVPVYEDDMTDPEAVKIDPVTQQNMGIRLAKATKGPLIHTLRTYGHITPDETLTAQVNLKTSGWIEKLHVILRGNMSKKGSPCLTCILPSWWRLRKNIWWLSAPWGNPVASGGRVCWVLPETGSGFLTFRKARSRPWKNQGRSKRP